MDEPVDPDELAAATALDRDIDLVLAGRPSRRTDPAVVWLSAAMRPDPPPALHDRVLAEHARRELRRWRPAQVAAAALAALFLTQGLGNIFNGAWVARGLGEHHSPHIFGESGLALLAVGVAVAAGVLWRRWLPLSVATGAPLGAAYGVLGVGEIGQFAAGALLHLSQGAIAVALAVIWWRARRYGRPPRDEGGA